jgi:putative peptidoglycan lipid II flippase
VVKKIFYFFLGTTFRKGASILSVLTFTSYVLGLIRDRIFARTFGASEILDTYNAAFIIPNLLLNIFVAGALTAAFTPIFTQLWSTDDDETEANQVATTVMHSAVFIILIMGTLAFIFMPMLTPYVAKGFDAEQMKSLVSTSRLLILSPLIFALSNTFGSILISYERFIAYGLSPILYNIGIISGAYFAKSMGINGLVLGVILGALLHMIVRLISVARSKFKLTYPLAFKNKSFKQILKLMVPRMVGQPVEQLTFLAFTSIASTLFVGSITILGFARNFQSVPVSLFGISFATAVFSSLAKKVAQKDRAGFRHHFWETAKWLLIASGLSSIFFFFFGELVIQIFLGGRNFTPEHIAATGKMLAFFAFSIPAETFIHLLARGFYSFKDTYTTVIVSVIGLVFIIGLSKFFAGPFGLNGLPIAFSIVLNIEILILGLLLYRKYRRWDAPQSLPAAPE